MGRPECPGRRLRVGGFRGRGRCGGGLPSFGDAGQVFDPWAYLGYLAAATEQIALGTTSTVLPLRHPLHTAKAATSTDHLSGGRLFLGVATGDRTVKYPAFGEDHEDRATTFQSASRCCAGSPSNVSPRWTLRWAACTAPTCCPSPPAGPCRYS